MMTIEEARQIDPKLDSVPDEELQQAIHELYDLAELAFECWLKEKQPPVVAVRL